MSANTDNDDDGDGIGNRLPVPRPDDRPVRVRERAENGGRWLMNQLSRRVQLEEELHDSLDAAQRGRWAVVIKPPKSAESGDVLESGEELCRSLHGEGDRLAMEIHKTADDGVQFHWVVDDRAAARDLLTDILTAYPHAEGDIERAALPIYEGDVVRVDHIELAQDHLLPLLSAVSDDLPDGDPLGGTIDALSDTADARCVLQTVVEPSDADWTTRWSRGTPLRRADHRWWRLPPDRVSRWDTLPEAIGATLLVAGGWWVVARWFSGYLTSSVNALFVGLGLLCCGFWWATMFGHPRTSSRQTHEDIANQVRKNEFEEGSATSAQRSTGDAIAQQGREPAFRVSMRVISIARSADRATAIRDRVGNRLQSAFHDPATEQRPELVPSRRLATVLQRVAARDPRRQPIKHTLDSLLCRSRRRTPLWATPPELSSLASHLPDVDSVSRGGVAFAPPRLRTPLPAHAPSYRRPTDGEGAVLGDAVPLHSPLVQAGRWLSTRLPAPLRARLDARGDDDGDGTARVAHEVDADDIAIPAWVTDEDDLALDPDERKAAIHDRLGAVEVDVMEHSKGEDTVRMGSWGREMIEAHRERDGHPDEIVIGYQQQGDRVQEVCVPFKAFFRHMLIQGVTGGGKSTLAEVILSQWANAGFGFAVPDPSGELVRDILTWLPEHRHDDIVWFSPDPDADQRRCGINLLTVNRDPDDHDYDSRVNDQVDLLVACLKAAKDGRWGARMIDIIRMLGRAMISSPDEEFTLVDMHRAVIDESARKEVSKRAGADDHFLGRVTKRIAELDDDEFDSLLRRLNEWVTDPVSRQTIGHKGDHGTIDLEEAIEEGKIILFDNDISNEGLQRMLGTGTWGTARNVCFNRPEGEREPFMVLADECDDYIVEEMKVGEQLRNARKYGLCLIMMTQYLGAIDEPDVVQAIDEECATTITLPMKGEEAPKIARRLGLASPDILTRLEQFHAIVELEIDRKPHGPYEISLFPPPAEHRTRAEGYREIVVPTLERDGREPLTDAEIRAEMVLGDDGDERFVTETEDGRVVEDDPLELTDDRKREIVRAIHDEAIVRGGSSDGVRLDHAADRIRQYHDRGEELADQSLSTVLNRLPTGEDGLIDRREDDGGDIWVRATARGRTLLFDTGRSGSSGGAGHDQLLRDAYDPLTKAGLTVEIEAQTGDEQADATGTASPTIVDREVVGWSNLTHVDKRAMTTSLAEDHPHLAHLLLGRDAPLSDAQREDNEEPDTDVHPLRKRDLAVSLEAEKSTGSTKGGYTARNVAKAVKSTTHERCLLLCRPDTAPKVARTLTDPPFVTSRGTPDGHEHRFYNLDNLVIAEEIMLRPERPDDGQDHTVWSRDAETDEIVLSGTGKNEHARFGDAEDVFSGPRGYPMTHPAEEVDDGSDIPDGYKAVKKPFLPAREFPDGKTPDENEWEIVIVPPDAKDPEDLALYRDGESIPLGEVGEWERDRAENERMTEIMGDILNEFDRAPGEQND